MLYGFDLTDSMKGIKLLSKFNSLLKNKQQQQQQQQ